MKKFIDKKTEPFMGSNKQYNFVYIIKNLINNHWYGGKHSSLELMDSYPGSGPILKAAYRKYGRTNFEMQICAFFETSDLAYEFEELLVDQDVVDNPKCYNLRLGGKGGTSGYKHTEEAKAKISSYSKSRIISEETRKKMSSRQLGGKHHNYGKPSYMRGKSLSDEAKAKISNSQKLIKAIKGVNLLTCDTIEFESAQDARRALGLPGASNIIKAANNSKTAYGYRWLWLNK